MPLYKQPARNHQARPKGNRVVYWVAAVILLVATLLAPLAAFAASPARPRPAPAVAPVAAPRAQTTVERWVDGWTGSNTMQDEDDDDIPSNCSRQVVPGEEEGDPDVYIYRSCKTLAYAVSISNPGDIIRVTGGYTYVESFVINKNLTIIGNFAPGFGAQIEPPRYPGIFDTVIQGAVIVNGTSYAFNDPTSMEVRLDGVKVTSGGIDILSVNSFSEIPPRFAARVNVTLEGVTVYNVFDGGSGINLVGAGNKLIATKTIIDNNRGSTGGGIFAGSGTLMQLGEGTVIKNNQATANGGGIGATSAATITISGGVTFTSNSATSGGGIYGSSTPLDIGSDVYLGGNTATQGGGVYLNGGTPKFSGPILVGNGNGSTTHGGGIYVNGGAPTLDNLQLTQNQAQNGGGIYLNNLTGGTLGSSSLMSNTASSSGGGYFINGGTDLVASSLTVQGNSAASHGGGGYVTGANNTSKRVTVQGNDFIGNTATSNGGGLFVISSALSMLGNTFTANDANSGGGLYLESSGSTNAGSSTFTSNTANYGAGLCLINNNGTKFSGLDLITNVADVQGGGLFAQNNNSVTIGSSTIQDNTSDDQGAGLYAINSTLVFTSAAFFSGNIAQGNGGGGYLANNALLTFETLDFLENEASAGGGFYADGGRAAATGATSMVGNVATNGNGGALYLKGSGSTSTSISNLFAQNNEADNGGAFYADGINLTLGSAEFNGNSAESGNGGGVYFTNSTVTFQNAANLLNNEASASGGGLYANASNLTFSNGATFSTNKALGGNGGAAYLTGSSGNSTAFGATTFIDNTASDSGGGLYASAVAVTVGATASFQNNIAQGGNGGGFYLTGTSLALNSVSLQGNRAFVTGGGGYLTSGSLNVVSTTLNDNRSQSGAGGGFATLDATTVVISATTFTANIGATDGGALHITNSPLTVQGNSTFATNAATSGRGGAIFVNGSNTTLNTLTFSKNSAGNGGGALHLTTGALTLQNSTLSENNGGTLTGTGGGAYVKAASATITGNTFSKNQAHSGAGLYLADTPTASLTSLQFLENNSNGPGGGLYFHTSTATLDASTLRANQASGEGGAIHALYSTVNVINTLVATNRVNILTNYAAGVYLSNTVFNGTHVTFANNVHQNLQGSAHAFYVAAPVGAAGGAPTESSLTLINTIVSGQAVGVNLLAGNNATFDAVLWNNDHFNWTGDGSFSVTRSRRGDPRFVAVATNDFRIRRDSAAFDQGISTSVAVDRDGIARTQSLAPDLGAFEHRYTAGLYLTTNISTRFVHVGDSLILQLRVKNQSATPANNVVLRATLPSQLPSPVISQGSCQGIFCEVQLGTLASGADLTIEITVGVGGTPLNTGLLTLLTNVTLQSSFTDSDTSTPLLAYLQNCYAEVNGTTHKSVQAALDAASNGQTIRISGICGAVHQSGGPGQLLTINKDVTLQGGWNSNFTTLNPIATPTYLDTAAFGRVVYINGNFAPTFENLIIRNGSASALGGGPAGKDAGGGVYINGGTPRFTNVDIANNQSPDLGGGVYLASPNVINFEGGFVRNNTSGERGGGLYIDQSAPILTGVNIVGNTAHGGGGVYLYRSPAQFIDNAPLIGATRSAPTCRFDTNTSTVMPNYVPGPSGDGLPVLWLAPGGGGGMVLDESAATVRGCAFNGNTARVGGGAYVHNSAAFIENTLFTSNVAQQPAPAAILIGPGGVRDGDGGGLVLDNQDPAAITLRGLLLGSNQAVRGGGMLTRLARAGTLTLPHFTINTNSGGNAVFALGESRLAFFNSIVAFNTGGAALFAQAGGSGETASITLEHTLFHPPAQTKTGSSGGGSVVSTTEFTNDPAFKNDGYHLKRISFAFGVGANTFTFADRDGTVRPVGAKVELGADEYATAITTRYVAVGGAGSAPCTDYRTPCASLQTAIDAASNGDYIKVAGGTYSGVRTDGGRTHHAIVQKSITIEGGYFARTDTNIVTEGLFTLQDWEDSHPVETPTVIDVNQQGRVFYIGGNIGGNVTPTLANLTLRRGNATTQADGPAGSSGGGGGGVYVDGASPTFRNVIVEESRANFGSGFYLRNAGGSYTSVTALANGNGVTDARGGAFYIEGGTPTLQNMSIRTNIAITGAGIYLNNSAATLIQNTVQSNGNATTLDGGGIFVLGGTPSLITNTIAINQAQHGGGVLLQNSNAIVRGNTVNNNRAGTNPAPSGQSDGLGGGLYVVGGAPQVTLNTISNNQAIHPALSYGGGIYVAQTAMMLTGNTISNNQAHRGGGLYFAATTNLTVQGNTLTSNVAQAPSETLRASGGGIYLATTTITLTNNTLNQNSAPYGGGIYVLGVGHNTIQQNTLGNNEASKDGGGVYLDGSDATLDSNTLQANRTTGGRGGGLFARNGQATLRLNTFTGNQATLEGGGIYLSSDGTSLQGDTIQTSQAGDGAGIYIDGPLPGAAQAQPWLNQVTLAENSAGNHGGALYMRGSAGQITNSTLRDNVAAVDGGGAYVDESTPIAFSGNVIRDNTAGDQGGGLYITRRSAGRYQSNAVVENGATQGGGIFVGGASPILIHTTFTRNGSALFATMLDDDPTTVVLTNTIVSGHLVGIQGANGTSIATYNTLWHDNGADLFGDGALTSSNDIGGTPNFQADGYHLNLPTAAADKGIAGDVAVGSDVDNEGRFQGGGPELGADELTASCAIIVAGSPNDVYSTLQQAINNAPNNSELLVAGTCTGVTTNGGKPQLAYFDKNLTVRGGFEAGEWDVSLPATQPAVLDAKGLGRVVRVVGSVRVGLENITLINGSAVGLGGGAGNTDVGGNIWVDNGQLALTGVDVVNGRAALGGGLYLRAPIALVSDSQFRNNFATVAGGAIYLDNAPTSVQIGSSRLTSNRAADGAAIYVAAGTPILLGNTVQGNQTIGGSGRGGGFYLAASNANVNRNRLEGNRAGLGGGIYFTGGRPLLTNNMFIRNVGIVNGGALYSINTPLDVRHSTFVANSTVASGGSALHFATPTSSQPLTMTNNILVDHTLAISVATGNQMSMRATLWNNNQTKFAGAVDEGTNFLNADPIFVNPLIGNYRLQESSPAVDRGVNIGVTDDIDGQPRPARQSFDIGADEYLRASINVSLNALPNPVASGATQTYLLQVVNNGDIDVVATIALALPNVLTPQVTPRWENVPIARGAIWEQTLSAIVDEDYTGALNATMSVTTLEGAVATASAASTAAAISGEILEFSGETLPNPATPGNEVELSLRIVNRGGIPLTADVQTQLPSGFTTNGPLNFSPQIAAPDGIWTARLRVTLDADFPPRTPNGDFNQLVTTFLVETNQGTSHTFEIVTTVAVPDMVMSRTPSPRPAIAGRPLVYTLRVTNTGNVALPATLTNIFPSQVALEDFGGDQPIFTVIEPGQSYQRNITTTVEAGYAGPLVGSMELSTDVGVNALMQDDLEAQNQSLTPTSTAKGGDWHDPASWEPPGVPSKNAIVLIPEGITLFSTQPLSLVGLINSGTLELRTAIGSSQAMTISNILENYGEILGRDGTGAGQAGLTLNLTTAILYNEGTICAGDGAPDGGAGGDLVIIAGSTTNKGIFCAGNGANVNSPNANLPGGAGGEILLAFEPGLFTNVGQVLAGNGGNSHPDAVPPQPGGNGGDVTIVATAAARLNDSDIRGGNGGTGSNGTLNGSVGQVVIGAPVIESEGTRFSSGTVQLFDQSNDAYNFTAIGPDLVTVSPITGLALFSIRIFNRGARADTFVASPLTTPEGWTVNNLPSTLTLRPFRSNLIFVVLTVPTDQVMASINQSFGVVISSQNDAGNQIVVPLRVVSAEEGFAIQLPMITR